MVLRVDKEKGYIDLSKRYAKRELKLESLPRDILRGHRRVAQEDIQKCEERFNKSKMVRRDSMHG
jgi:translation initiation factor 2 subunit 1